MRPRGFVLPLDQVLTRCWGRLGSRPCRLDQRETENVDVGAGISEEEEEVESQEEALPGRLGWSMAAVREPKNQWAQSSSEVVVAATVAAAAAAEAAAETAAAAAAADALNHGFDEM